MFLSSEKFPTQNEERGPKGRNQSHAEDERRCDRVTARTHLPEAMALGGPSQRLHFVGHPGDAFFKTAALLAGNVENVSLVGEAVNERAGADRIAKLWRSNFFL